MNKELGCQMNKVVLIKSILLSVFILCVYNIKVRAQNSYQVSDFNVVVGKITDDEGNPLPGVTIRIKGKTIGTVTDGGGNFVIYVKKGDELIVSFIGYSASEIPLKDQPASLNANGLKITLNYKNILHVSGEEVRESPINVFPFPPLSGYTLAVLDNEIFDKTETLGQMDKVLIRALTSGGYDERSYFIIPDGFALVTRIESITDDGSSIFNSERFAINELKSPTFSDFFAPRSGLFRMFAFIVTNKPFNPSLKDADFEALKKLSRVGYNILPSDLANKKKGKDYFCTVLVYEFVSTKPNSKLTVQSAHLTAYEHLQRSKLLLKLNSK
ncbi:carboxypeptidase-like regulatory domain-containing protein [Mucilaginibacter oryzae]|uniref:carboxypeptidase-like regulatory domain-containing protein n=1 Tax=Mucilaginibacter oryzae TaxID=468058 RepID=UPI001472EF03|nr:carboxypeptidase-like regulatory domain-containing protein [Mucilaginibacter oryzae]